MVETTLVDRYELMDRVATGGMGTVYRATDTRLHREVAVKVLKPELAGDPRFVERFRREARAAAALSHPSIAGVFDYGEDEGHNFIVMELVRGRDLARMLRENGPLSNARAATIGAQIADALAHAHEGGLIHRDIKPANVIVGDADRIKVTDFGIARAQADSSLTATGSLLGTAQYISPEQASGEQVGPASDLYSAGIVLYEMLTGTVPFTGDSTLAVAMRHMKEDVPAPSALNPDVSPELDGIVARATAKRPKDRYLRANDLATALRAPVGAEADTRAVMTAAIAGGGSTAVMSTQGGREGDAAWPFPSHPPRWDPQVVGRVVISIFVLLGLTAAGLLFYRLADSDRPQRQRDRQGAVAPPAGTTGSTEPTETPAIEEVEVRDVRAFNYEDAQSVLEEDGLNVEIEEQESDAAPGVVLGTDPGAGTMVSPGDTVTLFVSTGPPEEEDDDEEGDDFVPPGQAKKDKGKDED
ncbi:MAG TPA: protein kinase [Actinomycetota bacterium]|nr:protein kinase [Actinomycetota bacterium]